jgi:hypothetical protein
MILARIDYFNYFENKFVEAFIFFLLWIVFYPLFLYYKTKIAKWKIYSTIALFGQRKELLNLVQIDNIVFDSSNVYSLGKAVLVEDLIHNELRLTQASMYNYFDDLLNMQEKWFQKIFRLWGLSQRDIILNLVREYESMQVAIRLLNIATLERNLEVAQKVRIRYIKKYKDVPNESTAIFKLVLNSNVDKVLAKYDRLMIPTRTLIVRQLIEKLTYHVGTEHLIQDIISEIVVNYTTALKTIHHSVNLWNGELKDISYKNHELNSDPDTKSQTNPKKGTLNDSN